ncbi:EAL domain-containing protein [Peteryoungia desertarenae]|uniref:EAL domain-containing protein n=1 Tax=Peteryoungia desertarenae TaxID=1813451 RepID=A0ABX6QJ13_9HYPH|nr:EAL domain-containing protein [Peteryoungia desertarenae]QLF68510.1 EAL domain-containing protein [Peteryoungia desertarenae]
MKHYPIGPNETKRLHALESIASAETQSNQALQAVCRTAERLFGVPIVLVSLVETDHQWFAAKCGLTIDRTAREISFCAHAICRDEVLVVEDARLDERFSDNPLVTGAPGIRFYAGAPLIFEEGVRIGTLCLIDRRPRALSNEDRERLIDLAAVVTSILQLNRSRADALTDNAEQKARQEALAVTNKSLTESKGRLSHWTRLSSDWIWETDADHRFTFVEGDSVAHRLDFAAWIGGRRWEILGDTTEDQLVWKRYRAMVEGQQPIREFCFSTKRTDGETIVVEINADPVFNDQQDFIGYRGISRDVTNREELLKRLKRAELIANETQHAIIITDEFARVTWTNPAFTTMTGYGLNEVKGRTPGSVLQCAETCQETVKAIRTALRRGEGIRTTILNQAKNGERYWLDIEIRPVRDADGRLEGFIALENDVTAWINETNRKSAVFENATAGIVIHNASGATVDCNQEALRILGVTADQLLGRTVTDPAWHLVNEHGEPLSFHEAPAVRALTGDTPVRNQIVGVRHADGRCRWLRANAQVFLVDANERQVLVSFTDVTEEEDARREIEKGRELLSSIIETIPDAVAAYDADDRLLLCNSAYKQFYSTSAPAIETGTPFSDILRYGLARGQYKDAGRSESERERWLADRLRRHRDPKPETMLQHLDDGRWLQVRERLSPSGIIVGVRTDITAIKRAEERIRIASESDHLTGLANRNAFLQRFKRTLEGGRHNDRKGVVALIDLDHFKDLNDTSGHDVGDAFLQQISERLQGAVRPNDTVARLGGDEFALLLPGITDRSQAKTVIARLIANVTRPLSVGGKQIDPQMSVGVAMYPEDGKDVTTLLKNADIAMYERKKSGRNGITIFDQQQKQQLSRRNYVAECLREVLRTDGLDVAFQAQVDLQTGRHLGFEALARWSHQQETISPAEFIPISDEFGLSADIDLQVLKKSLKRIRLLKDAGLDPGRVAVNLGTLTLRDTALPERVKDLLDKHGLNASDIEIEVTESVMIGRGHEKVKGNLLSLQRLGVSVALDDFGTGYASLTHLKDFCVDKIKIDRAFVSEIASDRSDEMIVKTIISLARSLNIRVVGEGIETEVQAKMLAGYGCHAGQGFRFHRPDVCLESIGRYLKGSVSPPTGGA